ncbi:MAG: hybrid sensor histidine kinase/response regulator [Candidatus Scalindua sp. AMX11]|nr:MAG: hybrid sensor histidine kinase/response regulator [Candidatus Scalindua sp.]NOG84075.1 hybrid sensor histidine kinase/response regulator [Planctomycetota bacterium]RZV62397.1 MAG: hybrid sensor histidine kinase/response regulator [Candidatus Scalindua sp. SCAELEC01]TDE63311.1 MAG: hybrid sensor histidine kinase/response regulator [Candidatus Scalindua sp. AMX11]GJQ57521.1 MAG: hypothetical protein SCALA701_03220 [Candidatus Scalindua sp.]
MDGIKRQLRHKFRIVTADDPVLGLKIFQNDGPFSIVVSDMKMPTMSGVEFISQIKSINEDVICLILSGKSHMDDTIDAINQGNIFRFLIKPCTKEELVSAIEKSIDYYDLRAEKKELLTVVEEKNRQINRYVSMIVHDLKNPIGAIKTLSDLLLSEEEKLDEEQKEFVGLIQKSAVDSLNDINEMMETIRTNNGNRILNLEQKNIVIEVEEVIENLDIFATNKNIQIILENSNGSMSNYDPKAVHDVLNNFISNAIKYSHTGKKIKVIIEDISDQEIRISVKDQGLGLSEDDTDNAFQEFKRLSSKPTAGESSTGMGLFIAKNLVEKMNGRVGVFSKGKNQGSTFWFTLRK